MATLRIYQSVADPDSIDFTNFGNGTITKDASTPGSQFSIEAESESFNLDITVNGSGFSYVNPNDNPDRGDIPTGGTVTSIEVDAVTPFGGIDVFDLSGISVPISAILAAAATEKTSDDLALIQKIFKGDDRVFGSDPDSAGLNSGNDILAAYDGNDTLDGGGGADTMNGGSGNDFVSYQSAGAGVKIDLSNLANNTGDAAGDVYNSISGVIGSKKADTIVGSDGEDRIAGGGGKDKLTGGDGADIFQFSTKLSAKAGPTISDFGDGKDQLNLDKSIFTEAREDAAGVIDRSFFVGAKAQTEDHRFIFNDDTGRLFYDEDGAGGAKQKLVAIFDDDVTLARTDLEMF